MTKRRKREISGSLVIDDWPLRWTLRSEQQWRADGNHLGLRISVERTDESHRELILEYPFVEMPGGKTERPDFKAERLEGDIRQAMELGWNPKSRGKPFTVVLD
jgi:hypothetical protein